MKKRALVLGGLIAAVAITGYSVSGTYAKYTSSAEASDTATIAKWGFSSDPIEIKLASLSNDDGTLIAPGYSGSYIFNYSGNASLNDTSKSEVPYKVSLEAKVTNTIQYLNGTTTPIQFAFTQLTNGATKVTFADSDYTLTADGLADEINKITAEGTYAIGWKWMDDGLGTNDELDTALGYVMSDVTNPKYVDVSKMAVTVTVNTTYTQDTDLADHQDNP